MRLVLFVFPVFRFLRTPRVELPEQPDMPPGRIIRIDLEDGRQQAGGLATHHKCHWNQSTRRRTSLNKCRDGLTPMARSAQQHEHPHEHCTADYKGEQRSDGGGGSVDSAFPGNSQELALQNSIVLQFDVPDRPTTPWKRTSLTNVRLPLLCWLRALVQGIGGNWAPPAQF